MKKACVGVFVKVKREKNDVTSFTSKVLRLKSGEPMKKKKKEKKSDHYFWRAKTCNWSLSPPQPICPLSRSHYIFLLLISIGLFFFLFFFFGMPLFSLIPFSVLILFYFFCAVTPSIFFTIAGFLSSCLPSWSSRSR